MSNMSSSGVPAVSSRGDAVRGGSGGGLLSFLSWIEKNWVTVPVSGSAPSAGRGDPPSLPGELRSGRPAPGPRQIELHRGENQEKRKSKSRQRGVAQALETGAGGAGGHLRDV